MNFFKSLFRFLFRKSSAAAGDIRLHLGCGTVRLPGWVNIDLNPPADQLFDLRLGLPFDGRTVAWIYSEHFFEHISLDDGVRCLKECRRVLRPGGVIRIAMPDLGYLVEKYAAQDWKNQDWLTWPEYKEIETRCEMLNVAMRSWGHVYLYDAEDLALRLSLCGFSEIRRCEWGKSAHPALARLETRQDSKLIVEARAE